MANQWNYVQNGQSLGPIPEEQLKAMLVAGRLSWADLVWCDGMTAWTAARQEPALAPASREPYPAVIELEESGGRIPPAKPFPPPQTDRHYVPPGATSQGAVPSEVV